MSFSLPDETLDLPQLNEKRRQFEQGIRGFLGDEEKQKFLSPAEKEKLVSLLADLELLTRDLGELPSLGMIGKLSSGKTSCVELLLGVVGTLGACQQTGTINAVEYNVTCEENAASTSFDEWRCEFMSEQEMLNLVPSYREKIKSELTCACMDDKNRSARDFALNARNLDGTANLNYVDEVFRFTPEKRYWKNLYDWAVSLYSKLPNSEVPILCKSLIELYLFAESGYYGREWFGKKCRISAEQGERLSVLDVSGSVRPVQASNNEFPSVPRNETDENGFLDITRIANCDKLRYLVKIIRVKVKAPTKTTKRFTVGGRLRLVDVPGLGSNLSSIRDKAIMGEILPELNGVLFVVDATNRDNLDDGINMLSAAKALDRTIFVCSKFDLLEFPKNKDEISLNFNKEPIFNAILDTRGEARFQNWENFNDLLRVFKTNFGSDYKRFVPFSLFYFLGHETKELEGYEDEGNTPDLFCDYANGEFLNNPYDNFRRSQSERIALAKGLKELVKTLRENYKPDQGQIVNMLESFYQDGGASRLTGAYEFLLRNAAADNRRTSLNNRLESLYNVYNEIERCVEKRCVKPTVGDGQNFSTQAAFNVVNQLKNWSDEQIWEPLKLKINEVLANNAQYSKQTFLAYLFALPIWDELYASQWIWNTSDYSLELGGSDYAGDSSLLCNDESRRLPQDTEEFFVQTIRGYYSVFVKKICDNLTTTPENSKFQSLVEVFTDLRRSFCISDDVLNELHNFCSLVQQRKDLIDSFGIVGNNWLDRQSCNFYLVLSNAFVRRCEDKIKEKRQIWENETWLRETYPLQLRRGNGDGTETSERKRIFPWNREFRQKFRDYLGANPAISQKKLSSERIRELKYQLLKSCEYLVDETYNTLRLATYAIVDNMKKEILDQVDKWENQIYSLDSNNGTTKVDQGYNEPQVEM